MVSPDSIDVKVGVGARRFAGRARDLVAEAGANTVGDLQNLLTTSQNRTRSERNSVSKAIDGLTSAFPISWTDFNTPRAGTSNLWSGRPGDLSLVGRGKRLGSFRDCYAASRSSLVNTATEQNTLISDTVKE